MYSTILIKSICYARLCPRAPGYSEELRHGAQASLMNVGGISQSSKSSPIDCDKCFESHKNGSERIIGRQ